MKKVILIGVPHHSNLGDHAIAIAEKEFIEKYFPDYEYAEVSEENVERCIENIKKHISDDDIIMLHGGGNLGDKYPFTENGRRKVVQTFPNNKIIVFPQTMHFSDTQNGIDELEKSKEIYGNHKDLTFFAREEKTYEIMRKELKDNKIYFSPDIVTILNKSSDTTASSRKGALIILRNDEESKIKNETKEKITDSVKKYFDKIEYTDTAKGGTIIQTEREDNLNEMLDKYRESELVITDRLHGMIFAAITATPCIALDNYNHKIKYSAKWFENLGYIKYIDSAEKTIEIENAIKELKNMSKKTYNNDFAIDIFDKIMDEVM